jgi:Lipid A 3-O-deacylase (PagL)
LKPALVRVVTITLICMTLPLFAQTSSPNTVSTQTRGQGSSPANAWTVFANTSVANATLYGTSRDRHLTLFGLQYARLLLDKNAFALNYTPEIIPLAVLSQPALGHFAVPARTPLTHHQIAYAVGANPIGAELVLLPHKRVQLFMGTTEGFLFFNRDVPSPLAAQFNFAFTVGTGVKARLTESTGISIGYFFHHFSNAAEAHQNPGLDSHLIRFGYIFGFPKKSQ